MKYKKYMYIVLEATG